MQNLHPIVGGGCRGKMDPNALLKTPQNPKDLLASCKDCENGLGPHI